MLFRCAVLDVLMIIFTFDSKKIIEILEDLQNKEKKLLDKIE